MVQPLIGVDNPAVFCCGVFTVNEDNWKGVIVLTDGVKRAVVYVVGGGFNLLKQATGSIDGWKKLAGVIAPIAALTKFGEFSIVAEALEAISAQFDTYKLLLGGMSWVNIGDDLFKKGLVEKHKSDNHHGENYVAFAKRILLIGVNTLKLAKFGNKIGLCADLALSFGGVPVLSILLAGVTTLGLIGNGLTFWTISNDKDEVNEKINRFLDSQLDKELPLEKENDLETKMDNLKVKLRALLKAAEVTKQDKPNLEVENEEIGSDEELSNSDEAVELGEITQPKTKELSEELDSEEIGEVIEPEDEYFANFSYAELKREIAIGKYKAKRADAKKVKTSKINEIRESSRAIHGAILANKDAADIKELRDQKSKLILDSAKIVAEYTAIKAESKAYRSMDLETFFEFKNVQFFSRMSELDQKRNKELRDFAINVISIPGVVLGLVKDYSGLGGVIDLFGCVGIHIDDEETMKAIISGISLFTGSSELFKFLYEENHKEELKKISAADFVDLEVA